MGILVIVVCSAMDCICMGVVVLSGHVNFFFVRVVLDWVWYLSDPFIEPDQSSYWDFGLTCRARSDKYNTNLSMQCKAWGEFRCGVFLKSSEKLYLRSSIWSGDSFRSKCFVRYWIFEHLIRHANLVKLYLRTDVNADNCFRTNKSL